MTLDEELRECRCFPVYLGKSESGRRKYAIAERMEDLPCRADFRLLMIDWDLDYVRELCARLNRKFEGRKTSAPGNLFRCWLGSEGGRHWYGILCIKAKMRPLLLLLLHKGLTPEQADGLLATRSAFRKSRVELHDTDQLLPRPAAANFGS